MPTPCSSAEQTVLLGVSFAKIEGIEDFVKFIKKKEYPTTIDEFIALKDEYVESTSKRPLFESTLAAKNSSEKKVKVPRVKRETPRSIFEKSMAPLLSLRKMDIIRKNKKIKELMNISDECQTYYSFLTSAIPNIEDDNTDLFPLKELTAPQILELSAFMWSDDAEIKEDTLLSSAVANLPFTFTYVDKLMSDVAPSAASVAASAAVSAAASAAASAAENNDATDNEDVQSDDEEAIPLTQAQAQTQPAPSTKKFVVKSTLKDVKVNFHKK
jgi:hypothetical protein